MIFPNSYADREGIEKKNTSAICSLHRLSHLMHPVFVIEFVESSFLLPGSHTTTQAQLRSHLSITARCHPRQPPKQRSGGKPIGTFLPTSPTGSSLILLTPPTQISIRSESFIFGTATKGISAVISVNIRQRGTSKSSIAAHNATEVR